MSELNSRVLETAAKMYAMREKAQKDKDYTAISKECQKRIRAVIKSEKCSDIDALQIVLKDALERGANDALHFYVAGYLDMLEDES